MNFVYPPASSEWCPLSTEALLVKITILLVVEVMLEEDMQEVEIFEVAFELTLSITTIAAVISIYVIFNLQKFVFISISDSYFKI